MKAWINLDAFQPGVDCIHVGKQPPKPKDGIHHLLYYNFIGPYKSEKELIGAWMLLGRSTLVSNCTTCNSFALDICVDLKSSTKEAQ